MAIVLHPHSFKDLAQFDPERLQEAGGIVGPMLELLHDRASHQIGMDKGTAAMIYLREAPSGWLFFGDRVMAAATDPAEWSCEVLTSDGNHFNLTRFLDGSYRLYDSAVTPKEDDSVRNGKTISDLLRGRALTWPKLDHYLWDGSTPVKMAR